MATPGEAGERIAAAWRRAGDERRRADRAAAIGARHERQLAEGSEAMREVHVSMARLHREMERRHRAAARIHTTHAERLERWRDLRPDEAPPPFVAAVAEVSGSGSALITLLDEHQNEALVSTSDPVAAAAHDLESTFGEGPTHDATTQRRLVVAHDATLERRWPLYGATMRQLGIRSVAAAPLHLAPHCFGALVVFHPRPVPKRAHVPPLDEVADVLTRTVLLADELALLADADRQQVVNQAAGMVSVQCGCSTSDALALIQARAFAEGEPIEVIAARVTGGELTLG